MLRRVLVTCIPSVEPVTFFAWIAGLCEELDALHYSPHLGSLHNCTRTLPKNLRLVHGDLTPRNILLDENDNVTGVIDFCFSGVGDPTLDLSNITLHSSPDHFKTTVLSSYQDLTNSKLNHRSLRNKRQFLSEIYSGYANHIRQNYPEITLPET